MNKSYALKRIGIFGAAPDTTNMGVSALYKSLVSGLAENLNEIELVIFDNQLGLRKEIQHLSGKDITVYKYGARAGKRILRPENVLNMLLMSKLGKLGRIFNMGIKLVDSCDAIIDVSGGDSFSDIYGFKRFNYINRVKQITIKRGVPLILAPQTYGPYRNSSCYASAVKSVRHAIMAWARDKDSFDILKSMAGDKYSDDTYRLGVDMAFLLPPESASNKIDESLSSLLARNNDGKIVIGMNISGLIYNDPKSAKENYKFKADYKKTVKGFVEKVLEDEKVQIVFISHVMDISGHYESDIKAAKDVYNTLSAELKSRVHISPTNLNESEVKWLISHMDWFCGTRMHSTIAGLSTFVPTASISYSDKTYGVFATCNQGNHVFDPRKMSEKEIILSLVNSFSVRESTKETMRKPVEIVKNKCSSQMGVIADYIESI